MIGMSAQEVDIMRAVEDDFWWYRALRGHVLKAIDAPPAAFDLLDAGCGSGGMLARVHERFPQANLTGIDLTPRSVEVTHMRGTGAKVVQGSINALPFHKASFDVVVSLDVLVCGGVEPDRALREMHRVLRPNGQLILNLAAFDFLRGSHDIAVNGVRRFTRPRIESLLRDAGFKVERWTYWNMTLLPAATLARMASRRRAHDSSLPSDLTPLAPPLNAALAGLTKFELAASRFFPLPFGTSIFTVARK
jgi:ubiquinone/menaquinone biosynthesis C-methylase UbiE